MSERTYKTGTNGTVQIKLPSGAIAFQTPTSLTSSDNVPASDWNKLWRMLRARHESLQWWVGDWWAYGEHRYGDRARKAAQGIIGLEYQTLMDYGCVCRSIKPSIRIEGVKFSLHRVVAPLQELEQKKWLARALQSKWSLSELKRQIAQPEERRTDEQNAPDWLASKNDQLTHARWLPKQFLIPDEYLENLTADEKAKFNCGVEELGAALIKTAKVNREKERQSASHAVDAGHQIRLDGIAGLPSGKRTNGKPHPTAVTERPADNLTNRNSAAGAQ